MQKSKFFPPVQSPPKWGLFQIIKGAIDAMLSFNELNATMRRAKRGDAEAQFNLAMWYESLGEPEEAERWFAQAAALGHLGAQLRRYRN